MTNSQNDTPFQMGEGISAIPSGDFLNLAFESEEDATGPDQASPAQTDPTLDETVAVPPGIMELPHAAALAAWQIEYAVSHLPFGQSSRLFALVPSAQILAENEEEMAQKDPQSLEQLRSLVAQNPDHLSAIEQVHVPAHMVEQSLTGVSWPEDIYGVGISTERIAIPFDPEKHADLDADELQELAAKATAQDMSRVIVTVDRGGNSWCIIHPATAESLEDISQGADLIPEMVKVLAGTLSAPFAGTAQSDTASNEPEENAKSQND